MIQNDQNGTLSQFLEAEKKLRKIRRLGLKKSGGIRRVNTIQQCFLYPRTPNGELAKLIQKREQELNRYSKLAIKVVEKGGIKLKNILIKKDPFVKPKCNTELCPICYETEFTVLNEKDRIPCGTSNVGYRWICTKCSSTYEGESARMNKVRAIEHLKDLKKNKKNSPLLKHLKSHHPEGAPKFKFQTTNRFFDALSRQADEAVRINNASSVKLMNSKSEFNSAPIGHVKMDKPWRKRTD